jgi:hypothetical protein
MQITLGFRYNVERYRSGVRVFSGEKMTRTAVLTHLGQFVADAMEQRGEMPECTTPRIFQDSVLQLEYTGLHGLDADRPTHILEITKL